MSSAFSASVILKLVDQLTGPLRKVEGAFANMQTAYRKHGQGMRDVGRSMSMYVTAPLAGLAFMASSTSIKFEDAFAGVRKVVGGTTQELKEMDIGIQNITKSVPDSYEQIANLARVAGQLGVQRENVLDFAKTIGDLSVTTLDLKGEEAATTLAQFSNIVQMSQKDVSRLGSALSYLGDSTATSERRIADMGLRIAAAGKQIGLSEAEVLGFSATLASLGMEAQAGGSAMSRIMVEMMKATVKGGQELELFARTSKMSAGEFQKAFKDDAVSTIVTFLQGVTDMGEKSVLLFDKLHLGGIRTGDALRRLAGSGDLLKENMKKGNKAWEENTYLASSAAIVYGTAGSQLKILWNDIRLLAREIGDLLVPMLLRLVNAGKPLLEWVRNLSTPMKQIIIVVMGMAAALGPLILGLGILNGAFAALGVTAAPVLLTLGSISAVLLTIVAAVAALSKALDNLKKGDLYGATTFGVIEDLAAGIRGTKKERPSIFKSAQAPTQETGEALGLSKMTPRAISAGIMKSATEIVLKIVGDKATSVQSVDKQKGDAKVNVITQGYLGLLGVD